MKTLQEIKDQQANQVGYNDWDSLVEQIQKDKDIDSMEWNMNNVAKRYAEHALDKLLERAKTDTEHKVLTINYQTILNVKHNLS